MVSAKLRTAKALFSQSPSAAIITPLGTILHGNKEADDTKRLKLEIFTLNPIIKICVE
jgi:hypothetical protein